MLTLCDYSRLLTRLKSFLIFDYVTVDSTCLSALVARVAEREAEWAEEADCTGHSDRRNFGAFVVVLSPVGGVSCKLYSSWDRRPLDADRIMPWSYPLASDPELSSNYIEESLFRVEEKVKQCNTSS